MTALLRISTLELLRLWSELEQALHGTNVHGSTDAKIGAYRFGHQDRVYDSRIWPEHNAEADMRSAQALHDLLTLFAAERHATVSIGHRFTGWHEVGPWVAETPFVGDVVVRVIPITSEKTP